MPTESSRDEQDLRDYLAALRRRWRWLVAPLVGFALLAMILTVVIPSTYEATARVLIGPSAAQDAVADAVEVNLLNEVNLARSDAATDLVRSRLQVAGDQDLPEGRIVAEPEADVLNFTFSGSTPTDAALLANTWADAYVEVKQTEARDSINEAVSKLQARLEALRDQRSQLRANLVTLENRLATAGASQLASLQLQVDREASAISGDLNLLDTQIAANLNSITQLQLAGELAAAGTARVVQQAALPADPVNGSLSRNLVIGLLAGALVGIAGALLVDNLDHSITDAEDIQRMGLTLLGVIPEAPRKQLRAGLSTVAQTQPGTTLADSYQKIRTALQFTTLGTDTKTILVTSPQQGDGKTTTATNLALALANVESRVVLADIDFRRPQIHTIFNTELIPGISDALVGHTTLRQVAVNHPELATTLVAMPAGTQPPNPATFLVSSRFSGLLSDLRNQADLTILDAPPVLPVADAVSIASQIDGVVLVVRAGTTTHDELTSAVESITRSGGQLLGVVVNSARAKATTYGVVGGQPGLAAHPSDGSGSGSGSPGAGNGSLANLAAGTNGAGQLSAPGSGPTGRPGDQVTPTGGPPTPSGPVSGVTTPASPADEPTRVPAVDQGPNATVVAGLNLTSPELADAAQAIDLTTPAPNPGPPPVQAPPADPVGPGAGGGGAEAANGRTPLSSQLAHGTPMPEAAELANWAPPVHDETAQVNLTPPEAWPQPASDPEASGSENDRGPEPEAGR